MVFIRAYWLILIILFIGSSLRFYNLGLIPGPVFDEVFYPVFALKYLQGETFFSVHPPLGSYILTFGMFVYDLLPWTEDIDFVASNIDSINPLSYRWIGAVSGVGLIYVGYRLALELYNKKIFASLVAIFFALDGSLLVDSRLGLINIYLTLFGFSAMLFFIKGIKSQSIGQFLMSGLMLGAVISVKWNGLGFWLSLLMFSFLLFAFNKAKINSDIKFKSCDLRQASLVFILPFFLYFAVWLPELAHNENTLLDRHSQMVSYHFDTTAQKPHPYSSPWYTWPMMIRPIGYFFDSTTILSLDGVTSENFKAIHLLPNPAINFLSFISIIVLTFKWVEMISKTLGTRKVHEEFYSIGLILIGFYANFLPWALASRSTFMYHYQPAACFAFMALAFLLYKQATKNEIENMILFYAALTLILFAAVYWLPLQLGLEISSISFYSRMWFETWI